MSFREIYIIPEGKHFLFVRLSNASQLHGPVVPALEVLLAFRCSCHLPLDNTFSDRTPPGPSTMPALAPVDVISKVETLAGSERVEINYYGHCLHST